MVGISCFLRRILKKIQFNDITAFYDDVIQENGGVNYRVKTLKILPKQDNNLKLFQNISNNIGVLPITEDIFLKICNLFYCSLL